VPEAFGGAGGERSAVTSALILEELGWGCAGLAVSLLAPGGFALPLLDCGTTAQRAEYLPLFAGERFHAASLALSEGRFAFDPSALCTAAERKGNGFVLSGSKRFVPLGDRASHFLVVTRGLDGATPLDAFLVPRDALGLQVGEQTERMLGLRAVPFAQLELARVELPASARLGGEAGCAAARVLHGAQLASLALALGVARAMYELALPYAKQRQAFGQPIAQKQAIAFMLAEMRIELDAMRWLIWKAASALDHGQDAARETALARVYVQREAMKIADHGVQIFGGHGYIRDYPVEMWYRNMRSVTLLDAVAAL
jgi:acyl-CoA dehydrogenase